jgi:DNA-binding NtrC family response regulator
MPHILVVHESATVRAELAQAFQAEGCTVAEADSSAAAAGEIWAGSFDAAVVSPSLPRVSGATLEEHLRSLAPEIVTVAIRREATARLVRKVMDLLDGGAAAA